jgi:SAM-dependent methyltransferase
MPFATGSVRPGDRVCQAGPMEATAGHRLYGDLAPWWPLLSPVTEYEAEAAFIATLLLSAALPVQDVLELGSGGGHVANHLERHFALTLVDLSPQMLDISRALNPRSRHLVGDMRSVRLGASFDAVLIHDAIDYMTTVDELRDAVHTAFAHCRPGGMAVFLPDHVGETYAAGSDHGGVDGDDGRAARYLAWSWDPDPSDTWVLTQYAFLLRAADGGVDVVHEQHRTGLFGRDLWLDLLADAGFEPRAVEEETEEDRVPRTVLVGYRPRT